MIMQQVFGESYFDNYSVITGINGRGVNSGNINVQPLSDSRDGVDVNSYRRGPNYLVNVLKHEFGHGYSFLDVITLVIMNLMDQMIDGQRIGSMEKVHLTLLMFKTHKM